MKCTKSDTWGSSPLTRGKREEPEGPKVTVRLIPAHAGKTPCRARSAGRPEAHPRSRGENSLRGVFVPARDGSSPLTRGKLSEISGTSGAAGLIPAHAGKTTQPTAATGKNEAHPRSRGENRSMR